MEKGIISAAQPEAVEAGAEILKSGGNAVDATICAALVQTVVDPLMCGIAGQLSLNRSLQQNNLVNISVGLYLVSVKSSYFLLDNNSVISVLKFKFTVYNDS